MNRWPDWLPIDSAPKDGTDVLLYPSRVVARWDDGAEDWLIGFCDITFGLLGWEAPTGFLLLPVPSPIFPTPEGRESADGEYGRAQAEPKDDVA